MQIIFEVTIDSNKGSASQDPAKLADAIKAAAQQEIARMYRNGGQLA